MNMEVWQHKKLQICYESKFYIENNQRPIKKYTSTKTIQVVYHRSWD